MSWCHIYYITSVILYIYSGYVTASEYYVSADPNGESCPSTDLPCHNLSYYTADYISYFTDDTIFYFLEGTHTLHDTLEISDVSNITLQGLGHIEQGFHKTVMQSTSVIRCSDYNRGGIQFTNSTDVVLKSITIANCGSLYNTSYLVYNINVNINLYFVDINNVTLEWVSVQNSSGIGLVLYKAFDVLIINSTFANNGDLKTDVGNALIYYDDQVKKLSRVNIMKSNFTLGLGSGMSLVYNVDNDIEVEIIIENSEFSHNIVQYGGGVYIFINNGRGSIEFSDCNIYNNTATNGGGMAIDLHNGSGSIEFSDCNIYNNIATNGGGMAIDLHNESGSTEFSNCTIYNNTAWSGGGVYILLQNGSGSIECSDCNIYNNTATIGGGMYIDLQNGNSSTEFSNCTIYNNTARISGGGMTIYLHNENGSTVFSNCTIYNNTARGGGGVYILLQNGSGSIECSDCNIYNNTATIGGGMYIDLQNGNSSTEFSNCTIYNNTARISGGGMAIYLHNENGSTVFSNCTIYNNTARGGGGVYILLQNGSGSIECSDCNIYNNTATIGGGMAIDLHNESGSTEFSNCTIYNNTARISGGGMAIYLHNENGGTVFSNCTIYNNTARGGGGVYILLQNGSGSIECSDCNIYNNTATIGGGMAIDLHNGSGSIEFSDCNIYNNIATNGGGMAIDLHNGSGSTEFSDCNIYNNTAWYGGGMTIYFKNGSRSTEFSNCTIYNNTAWSGGGMAIDLQNGNSSTEFSNCIIYNNTARISGGGMAIYLHNENGSTVFSNCTIYNNTARGGGGVYILLQNGSGSIECSDCNIYNNTARIGGGMAIYLHNGSGSTEFSDCNIYNNTAWYGGGMTIYFKNGSGSTEFSNCTIHNNTAGYGGGGVYIDLNNESSSIEFSNCTIYNNTSMWGGGIHIRLYNRSFGIEFSNCTIYNNTAFYGSGLFINALYYTSTSSIHFTNVSFQFNRLPNKLNKYQSAVFLVNIENVMFSQIDISNHNTTGLVSINSPIIFDGHSTFVNNSGINGGGIALYGFCQLLLKPNTNISFVNNHASESGGGIFVSQVVYNIDIINCPFKNLSYYNNGTKRMLYFVNNTADISGDVLYGGKISNCINFDFDHQFHYPKQKGLSVVSSDPIKVCFCESNIQNCSITNINITAIPGINVNISLATVGNKDGLTKGVIKLTTSDSSSSTVQTDNTRLNATCTNVTFKLTANSSLNTTKVYVTLEDLISGLSFEVYPIFIDISIESCPIGYPLVNDTCVCRSELNTSSITCDINTQIITRDGDMWIGYNNDSDCLIVYPHCPFDYCNDGTVQFKITSPDPQCLYNRSGILCGQCSEGLSLMLGSNQCGQCTNNYIALIIPFGLAGIALVAFIIALNLTVSLGTINGLIFYANVVKIYEPIFFPNGPVKVLSQFISWVNLDLGIETCFIDGMDSCSKTWLQFIFPAYVWFLLILIVISSQYSSKVVRLVGSHAVPVLATMILLSYTKLIRTVFKALYFINIQCNGNNNVTLLRWYIDANVQYVGGYCHLPLFLFSVAVLILLIVPYTFYLLAIPLFEGPLSKYMCCCQKYMKPFFDAYGGPYKDKCRFWTGFLLLVRVILALVVSLDIKATISLDVLTSLLFVIISMYFLLKGIYQHLPLACLEMSFFLNLMFIAYVSVQTYKASHSRQLLSVGLVSVSFVIFCGIILYHVWDYLSKSCLKQPIAKIMKVFKKPPPDPVTDDAEIPLMCPGSPALLCETSSVTVVSVVMRRESLLDDEDY